MITSEVERRVVEVDVAEGVEDDKLGVTIRACQLVIYNFDRVLPIVGDRDGIQFRTVPQYNKA